MKLALGIVFSYLVGSIPAGYLVGKWIRGIDIRKHGSGNVGATNVFRVVGKKWGIAVLLFDVFKGFVPTFWFPLYFGIEAGPFHPNSIVFGLAAILGHTWTIFLRFRGGKGVATSLGVFLALVPKATGAALTVWGVIFGWKRYVSLASLGMALSFPGWIVIFYRGSEFFRLLFLISIALAAFIFYTHRENIRRLREGREKRLI